MPSECGTSLRMPYWPVETAKETPGCARAPPAPKRTSRAAPDAAARQARRMSGSDAGIRRAVLRTGPARTRARDRGPAGEVHHYHVQAPLPDGEDDLYEDFKR